ncbi:MAG TPA: ATP-binding protein [Planctomycetota bacterium]|nr:ATP-binding protein [Planctomycetota bacterium]
MPIRVLHIEDNPSDALLLRAMLHETGGNAFELAHVERLAPALERLAREPFDVALVDLSLPDSFGIGTFEKVRACSPHVPVIVLSGLDDEAAAMQTVHAGAQDYLCKDELDARMLVRAIRYAIERHRADEALEADRVLLRALIDSLPDQIYVKDYKSRFIVCNQAVAARMGHESPETVVGKSDFDFFPRELAERFFNEEMTVLAGNPRVNREEPIEIAGESRWMLTTKVPLRDKSGMIVGLVGINRDITERKLAEDRLVRVLADLKKTNEDLKTAQLQLIQAEKMESVGRLAAGVAHEVKNPLAVAVMGLDYLKNTLGVEHAAALAVLRDVYDAIKRADTVIGGLLDFSRPRTLVLKPEDICELLEQSLTMVRHDMSTKRIALHKDLCELPRLRVDGNKVKQVLINLLMNAIQAVQEDGRLDVATSLSGAAQMRDAGINFPPENKLGSGDKCVVVRIDDSGPGISDENLSKIFDPYFTTKPPGQGTGLGLSVARQIAEMHGGALDVRNRPEGGVRATVALPV